MNSNETTYYLDTVTISIHRDMVTDISLPTVQKASGITESRDIGIPIPEIVSLIASLAPGLISLLSGIKGSKRRKYEAIEEVMKSDKTDSEKVMLTQQILKI